MSRHNKPSQELIAKRNYESRFKSEEHQQRVEWNAYKAAFRNHKEPSDREVMCDLLGILSSSLHEQKNPLYASRIKMIDSIVKAGLADEVNSLTGPYKYLSTHTYGNPLVSVYECIMCDGHTHASPNSAKLEFLELCAYDSLDCKMNFPQIATTILAQFVTAKLEEGTLVQWRNEDALAKKALLRQQREKELAEVIEPVHQTHQVTSELEHKPPAPKQQKSRKGWKKLDF